MDAIQPTLQFFNTTNLSREKLREASFKAVGQNKLILDFFHRFPEREFTPFEVQRNTGIKAPITSIRRAINTLTREGYLVKTEVKREGDYGTLNYTWRYNRH